MELKFKGKWRAYQERVLGEITLHLRDKRLHIVAAPGAGKTTLGIEVIARLKDAALILTPTLTIRNQWKNRILAAFTEGAGQDFISLDIRKPAFITIITYQALLASFCSAPDDDALEVDCQDNENEDNDAKPEEETSKLFTRFDEEKAKNIIALLEAAKIKTFCFDEAHHLRNEWWKALDYLTANMAAAHTISLTATPPYDVNFNEWQRYEKLCGPIDSLISVPELVKAGDLCPHQDFVYLSKLRDNEAQALDGRNQNAINFLDNLNNGYADLAAALIAAPYFTDSANYIEDIFDDADFYISIGSFAKSKNLALPKCFLDIFEVKEAQIPPFDIYWMEKFLNGLIYKNRAKFTAYEEQIKSLYNDVKKHNLASQKTISFFKDKNLLKTLAGSLSKLDSIKEIALLEYRNLKENLRMVILADYIREDALSHGISALGVAPIFMTLCQNRNLPRCAVLTGSLIILPSDQEKDFLELAKNYNLPANAFTISTLKYCGDYLKVEPSQSGRQVMVAIITRMFNEGKINILIGTQALLGEGWDAPSINSLILSSTVSSYMLSNQMRGRAIRKDKNNKDKVSNIWHLASVRNINVLDALKKRLPLMHNCAGLMQFDILELNHDILQLQNRFKGFHAPSFKQPYTIENGMERLGLNFKDIIMNEAISQANSSTVKAAQDRQKTAQIWRQVLDEGYYNVSEGIRVEEKNPEEKPLVFNKTLKYSLLANFAVACGIFGFTAYMPAFGWYIKLGLSFGVFAVLSAPLLLRWFRTGTPEKNLRQILRCVVETLSAMDIVKTSLDIIGLEVKQEQAQMGNNIIAGGIYTIAINNVTPEESNQIRKAFNEVLAPVNNPKYMISRYGKVLGIKLFATIDYHNVPEVICRNKKYAEVFAALWRRYVANGDLIFTRNAEGHKLLLKLRKKAFSAHWADTKDFSRWG